MKKYRYRILLASLAVVLAGCQAPTGNSPAEPANTHYIDLTINIPGPMIVQVMDISWGDFEGLVTPINYPSFPYHYTIYTDTQTENFDITSYANEGSFRGSTTVDTRGVGPFTASYTLKSQFH